MGKEFPYLVKYRLTLRVGGYYDRDQFVTVHSLQVDASDFTVPVEPEVRAGLVERALEVLLLEREGKGA